MAKQPTLNEDFEADQARYRRAREPHDSKQTAEREVKTFIAEVEELRVKHQIKDLYLIYNTAFIDRENSESIASGMMGLGDQALFEPMAASAYGYEKRRREEVIRKMLADE